MADHWCHKFNQYIMDRMEKESVTSNTQGLIRLEWQPVGNA
jgi:hypothetical protein